MSGDRAGDSETVEWAGRSARDQAIRRYLESQIPWKKRHNLRLPVTLLLGPRGSGKTTLLRHLDEVSVELPHARLDLAALGKKGGDFVDVLANLSISLHERRKGFPRFEFPAFGTAAIAIRAPFDGTTPKAADQSILNALASADVETVRRLSSLADAAALVLPTPATAVLRALPALRNIWLRRRIHRRLAHLQDGRPRPDGVDRLNRLRAALDSGDGDDQRDAETELLRMFLADLRRMYRASAVVAAPPARCVLLLDNVDSELGNRFLQLLLEVRDTASVDDSTDSGDSDPLLVLATSGSYPQAIQDDRWGGRLFSGVLPGRWEAENEEFRPEQVRKGLRIGRLRDLSRPEVELQARAVIHNADKRLLPAKAENGVRWLGWVVHQLTHGHPAATEGVLRSLRGSDDIGVEEPTRWDDRLRRVFAPDSPLIDELLARLLPLGASEELVRVLPYAAASVEPVQAEVAGLTGPPDSAVRKEFEAFSQNVLHTMHIDDGDPAVDGPPETLHPMLRLLLLQRLAASDDAAWTAAHKDLRRAAEASEEPRSGGTATYHALALGDVQAAAVFLNDQFGLGEEADALQWCESLCRLRRAPAKGLGAVPGTSPSERYERLLEFLNEGPVENRLRTVSRLLAAMWLGPEPPPDPKTDQIGDPLRNPLGDPGAELYGEVAQRLRTLAYAHDTNPEWSRVLKNKAAQYERTPW